MAQSSNQTTKPRPKELDISSSSCQRHRLPSEPVDTLANLSSAERYIAEQSQMLDLKTFPSDNRSTVSSITSMNHNQIMDGWREKEINERYKSEPSKYKYGTPPPRSSNQKTDNQTSSSSSSFRSFLKRK
ncbi:hypothetical protein I4U23_013202 [Adineta vaga]|nr:hypothetical protein I4U23_013202 [Adineta vaga]